MRGLWRKDFRHPELVKGSASDKSSRNSNDLIFRELILRQAQDDGGAVLDNRTRKPANEIPGAFTGEEKVIAQHEHSKNDDSEDNGKKRPCLDVAGIIGRVLGAHERK